MKLTKKILGYSGTEKSLSLPPMGLTGLFQPCPNKDLPRHSIATEFAKNWPRPRRVQSISEEEIADLSELELEDFPQELSDDTFAPIDSWNDQTEMIEDHDEFLELVSSSGLNWPSDTLSSVESNPLPDQGSDSATLAGMRSFSLSEINQGQFPDDSVLADNTESDVRAVQLEPAPEDTEGQVKTDGQGMVGLLVGEQLSPNNDENRNIPRAPSLSIKDYSPSEPEESDDSSNVASIFTRSESSSYCEIKAVKLRPPQTMTLRY